MTTLYNVFYCSFFSMDAMNAAKKANTNQSGYGTSFSGNPKTKDWSGAGGKTVWKSNDGNMKFSVGAGAYGNSSRVKGGQVGASFRMNF